MREESNRAFPLVTLSGERPLESPFKYHWSPWDDIAPCQSFSSINKIRSWVSNTRSISRSRVSRSISSKQANPCHFWVNCDALNCGVHFLKCRLFRAVDAVAAYVVDFHFIIYLAGAAMILGKAGVSSLQPNPILQVAELPREVDAQSRQAGGGRFA